MMPTVFSDERLARWTSVIPTATRVFPEGDLLTVTVPYSAAGPATARLSNAAGESVWEGTGVAVEGAAAVRFVVPLDRVDCRVCDLTVRSGPDMVRTTIGIVPTQAK